MRINELFTTNKDWDWEFNGNEEAVANFTVGKIPYTFIAYTSPEDYSTWEVEFRVSLRDRKRSYFGITGTGNSVEVFSTVVDIMKELLARRPEIKTITFTADEPSRQSLYKRMIRRLLPNWNLSIDGKQFILTANDRYSIT